MSETVWQDFQFEYPIQPGSMLIDLKRISGIEPNRNKAEPEID